jgi:hypothetical protein
LPQPLSRVIKDTKRGFFPRNLQSTIEHVPKKVLAFFDIETSDISMSQDMLQLFDFELRPYRSNDSI